MLKKKKDHRSKKTCVNPFVTMRYDRPGPQNGMFPRKNSLTLHAFGKESTCVDE